MARLFRSSGDLAADRRYDYGRDLLAAGDPAAAADLFRQALEIVPGWIHGWMALAEAGEAAGNRADAIAALRQALALDGADAAGARMHLARLGAADTPAAPPAAYVRELFDAYADDFDAALVDRLSYRAPQLIAGALDPAVTHARALDLGCGTGLMAPLLRGHVGWLAGVDLSAQMIARARARGLYDALTVADVVAALGRPEHLGLDLITAADVFCYLGDLAPVLAAAAGAANPGARLAFSVEAGAGDGVTLKDSLRYGHADAYLRDVLARTGWLLDTLDPAVLRQDRGADVPGRIVTARRA